MRGALFAFIGAIGFVAGAGVSYGPQAMMLAGFALMVVGGMFDVLLTEVRRRS